MKNLIGVISLLLLNVNISNLTPTIIFSDLDSAPNHGWSSNETSKGAAVTIWGYDFGDTRGTNYISVNGVKLVSDTDYAIWGEYWPTPLYQRITFWINDQVPVGVGNITVTVDGKASNSIPFTVRDDGDIFFVSNENTGTKDGSIENPFYQTSLTKYGKFQDSNIGEGDILYFRGGNYSGQGTGNKAIIRISGDYGNKTHPLALLSYPGESPNLYLPSSLHTVNFNEGALLVSKYLVFSGFKIDSIYGGITAIEDDIKLVGNDIQALKIKAYAGSGMINTRADNDLVFGNYIHGGNSKWRFDHGIYVSGCAPNSGNKVGWNYIDNNDFGTGVQIVVNHQQARCAFDTAILKSHFIFNNYIKCAPYRGAGIGIYDLSYDTGEEEPEPTFVYNNIVDSCGASQEYHSTLPDNLDHLSDSRGSAIAIKHSNGHARFYNNLIYNAGYRAFKIEDRSTAVTTIDGKTYHSLRLSTIFKNNIVMMAEGMGQVSNDGSYISFTSGQSKLNSFFSNNLYYGIGDYSVCNDCSEDINNVNNQNPLFVDSQNGDFSLQSNSPAINMGTSGIILEVLFPEYAPINRDFNYMLRSDGIYDIGPIEGEPVSYSSSSDATFTGSPQILADP